MYRKIYCTTIYEDKPFIVSFDIRYEDDISDNEDALDGDNKFRFLLSTKRLLKISLISTCFHADATLTNLNGKFFLYS